MASTTPVRSFSSLPIELQRQIFLFLRFPEQVAEVRKVCKLWKRIVQNSPYVLSLSAEDTKASNLERISSSFHGLTEICLETHTQTNEVEFYEFALPEFLRVFTGLRNLSVFYGTMTFAFLEKVSTSLRILECHRHDQNADKSDTSCFGLASRLVNLRTLSVPYISLVEEQFACLANCTNLAVLQVELHEKQRDLQLFCPLTSLRSLAIDQMDERVHFFEFALTAPLLENLALSYRPGIEDIDGVSKGVELLTSLHHLELSECTIIHKQLCKILEQLGSRLTTLKLETVFVTGEAGPSHKFALLTRIQTLELLDTTLMEEDINVLFNTLSFHKSIRKFSIEALDISDEHFICYLYQLESLESFYVNMCSVLSEKGISPVHLLNGLRSLSLGMNFAEQGDIALRGMTKLTKLQHLQLRDDFNLPNVKMAYINALTCLRKLEITGSETIWSVAQLQALFLLEELKLIRCSVHDLESINQFPVLTNLSLVDCTGINDDCVPYLEKATKLTSLNVTGTLISTENRARLKAFIKDNRKRI